MFDIPDYKKIRVIVDTDAACEADDPFAIVHALLSPKLIVKGICAEHFVVEGSMEQSYDEIITILKAMDMDDSAHQGQNISIPVLKGQQGPLAQDQTPSEAARFIIREAMKDDEKPLYILCQGAITNVAMAIRTAPEIVKRMTIIWIGTHGTSYGPVPFREFNAGNDVEAANLVLEKDTQLWLVPSYVYTTVNIGIAEIRRRIAPCGKIGEHLYQNLMAYNCSDGAGWTQGESWSLGDSPAIALAINPGCGRYEIAPAPHVAPDTASEERPANRPIRIYKDVDSRYILEDFIAKLEIYTSLT